MKVDSSCDGGGKLSSIFDFFPKSNNYSRCSRDFKFARIQEYRYNSTDSSGCGGGRLNDSSGSQRDTVGDDAYEQIIFVMEIETSVHKPERPIHSGRRKSGMDLPKLIAVVGTNASGKSSVGIDLAKRFTGEIISADSRQVYRSFDLCSGKVSKIERESVPHHLIDIRDIGEPFSVAEYQNMVYTLIPQIQKRGKIPFIVGGTGLYIDSVVRGYVLCENNANQELREELEQLSIEELQMKLTQEGRAFFDSNPSDYQNKRRVIRVLEKISCGEPIYYENAPKYEVLQIGITWTKEILHKRIEERLALRIQQGMIDEVTEYLNNGGNPDYLYDLGLEYRYILWYLTGKYASLDEFLIEMSRAIKRFAKKQLTWFRKNKDIIWLDTNDDYIGQACELVEGFLN